MRKLDFNSGNAIQTRRCYNTPLHSGSTQLNYEWRSIPREGRRRAGRSRDASTREKLRGFRGKIKREKIYDGVYYRHERSRNTCSIPLFHVIRPIYPSECNSPMLPFSLWPSWADTLTSNLKMNRARDLDSI